MNDDSFVPVCVCVSTYVQKKNNPLVADDGIEPTESLEGGEPAAAEKTCTEVS